MLCHILRIVFADYMSLKEFHKQYTLIALRYKGLAVDPVTILLMSTINLQVLRRNIYSGKQIGRFPSQFLPLIHMNQLMIVPGVYTLMGFSNGIL